MVVIVATYCRVITQCLLESEEKAIVKWCFDMHDRGFPARLDNVRAMTLYLEVKRVGGTIEPLGKNWITRFLN